MPLCVSVMGFSRDELAALVAAVAERDEVALIELNFSCPNVETGLIMGADPGETARSVEHLRPLTEQAADREADAERHRPGAVAVAAQDAGADALSLINTLKGMALDPRGSGRPWLGAGTGGVSGPAVRAIALQQVASVAQAVSIPVVGMGGIESGRDAADFLRAGASAIAVGTASFRDPGRRGAHRRRTTGGFRA